LPAIIVLDSRSSMRHLPSWWHWDPQDSDPRQYLQFSAITRLFYRQNPDWKAGILLMKITVLN